MTDALVTLLSGHGHAYDGDCGVDFGCYCEEITDYDASSVSHSQHLAEVIRRHFDVSERESVHPMTESIAKSDIGTTEDE